MWRYLSRVLSLPADASPEERFKIAQMAASAKKWSVAAEQLELVLKAAHRKSCKKPNPPLRKSKGNVDKIFFRAAL